MADTNYGNSWANFRFQEKIVGEIGYRHKTGRVIKSRTDIAAKLLPLLYDIIATKLLSILMVSQFYGSGKCT